MSALRPFVAVSLALLLAGCSTTHVRGELLSSTRVESKCTNEYEGTMMPSSPGKVQLTVSDRRSCSAAEVQRWSSVEVTKLNTMPRWIIAGATVVAMTIGYTLIVAAATSHDPVTYSELHTGGKSPDLSPLWGYPAVLAVGGGMFALLGIGWNSPPQVESEEVLVPGGAERVTQLPAEGSLRLASGAQLPLVQSRVEVDALELGSPVTISSVVVELVAEAGRPSLRMLIDAAPSCHAIASAEVASAGPEQVDAAARCSHAGWLLEPAWRERCAMLNKSCLTH